MVSLDKEMFVGKKDYSDKDIYENDYISADGYKGPVILQNNQWTVLDGYFSEDKVYKEAITINSFSSDDLIIIGSIKENPEMF